MGSCGPGLPWSGAGPWPPSAFPVPTQNSICTLASMVSGKFSCLLQALEMRRISAQRDIEVAKTQALAQARDEEQRIQGHLEAVAHSNRRIRDLLEHSDDQTFFQVPGLGAAVGGPACLPLVSKLIAAVPGTQESQLLVPPGPLGPLTPPQWDEDQQLGGLKESLSQLCGLLLDKEGPSEAPAEAADLGPMGKADSRSLPTPWGPAVPLTGDGGGVRAQPSMSSLPITS